jgi:hypothetical protein
MSGQGQKEGGRTLALLDELKAGQPGGLEYFSQCQFKPRCASKREKDGRELASAVKRALGRRRRAEDVREGRTVAEPEKRALVDPPAAGGERAVDLIEVVEHVVGRVDEEERLRRGGRVVSDSISGAYKKGTLLSGGRTHDDDVMRPLVRKKRQEVALMERQVRLVRDDVWKPDRPDHTVGAPMM